MEGVNIGKKIVVAEGFNFKKLKQVIKEFNDADLIDENIKTVGLAKEIVVSNFINGIEMVPDEKDDDVPESVAIVYNDFADFIDGKNDKITCFGDDRDNDIKEEPKKAVAKPKKAVTTREPRPNSRPGVLFSFMKKGKDLDQILKTAQVLEKYNNKTAWIRADYARLEGLLEKIG